MANLTVTQPSIQLLNVEITHGLSIERNANGPLSAWTTSESSLLGAKCTYFTPKDDQRDLLDGVTYDHQPFGVAMTVLIDSPMKLFMMNQNYSKILFGNDNTDNCKNVVRFETNLRWSELLDVLPTENKAPRGWKITDWNNLMNENKHFAGDDI